MFRNKVTYKDLVTGVELEGWCDSYQFQSTRYFINVGVWWANKHIQNSKELRSVANHPMAMVRYINKDAMSPQIVKVQFEYVEPCVYEVWPKYYEKLTNFELLKIIQSERKKITRAEQKESRYA